MLLKGSIVKVLSKHGIINAELLELCDADSKKKMWWVKHITNGLDVHLYQEDDLITWNTYRPCVCGALAVRSFRHSQYCEYNDVVL